MELFDILTVDRQNANDVLNIGTSWEDVIALTTPARVAGLYELNVSATWNFADTNDNVYFRFRINGGDWEHIIRETKDFSEILSFSYTKPFEKTDTVAAVIELQAMKDASPQNFNVLVADVLFKRIG